MALHSVFQNIMRQFQGDAVGEKSAQVESGLLMPEHDSGAGTRHIRQHNLRWATARVRRVQAHGVRIARHLKQRSRRRRQRNQGQRQAVQCVELARSFDSLSAAARFVGRAPENVYQAVKFGTRCGSYHWRRSAPVGEASASSLLQQDSASACTGLEEPAAATEVDCALRSETMPLSTPMERSDPQRPTREAHESALCHNSD